MKRILAWLILISLPTILLWEFVSIFGWYNVLMHLAIVALFFAIVIIVGLLMFWALDNIKKRD